MESQFPLAVDFYPDGTSVGNFWFVVINLAHIRDKNYIRRNGVDLKIFKWKLRGNFLHRCRKRFLSWRTRAQIVQTQRSQDEASGSFTCIMQSFKPHKHLKPAGFAKIQGEGSFFPATSLKKTVPFNAPLRLDERRNTIMSESSS